MKLKCIDTDRDGIEWRHPVELLKRTCSVKQWQVSGLQCEPAVFITSIRGAEGYILV